MKRSLAAVVAAAAVLLGAAAAHAKGVTNATVCGPERCIEVHGRAILMPPPPDDGPTEPPAPPSAWYRGRLTISDPSGSQAVHVAVLPRAGLLQRYVRERRRYTWIAMTTAAQRAYLRATRALRPYPASFLRGLHQPPPALDPPAAASGQAQWALGAAVVVGLGLAAWLLRRLGPSPGDGA